jgi:curved DNA-binding protein CbpA
MFSWDAMTILGLNYDECCDEQAIKRAWKQKVRLAHPDKNMQSNEQSTKQTQLLNEAKDVLLDRISGDDDREDERRAEEYEKQARKKEEAEREARHKEWDELYKKGLEARQERFVKNRKKRAPGSRAHRKITEYKEGKAFMDEMEAFFQEKFTCKSWNRLLFKDVLDLFVKSRENKSTALDINLFKRHSKKMFMEVWPNAVYCKTKNQRCLLHMDFKK